MSAEAAEHSGRTVGTCLLVGFLTGSISRAAGTTSNTLGFRFMLDMKRHQCELRPGISVSVQGKHEGVADRIQICSGTTRASSPSYVDVAFLPNRDWRDLSDVEYRMLDDQVREDKLGDAERITTWRLPRSISKHFNILRVAIEEHNNEGVVGKLFKHAEYRRGLDKLIDLCREAGMADGYRKLGYYIRKPGLTSLTVEEKEGKFVGLHVDSWARGAPDKRTGFPLRLCVNLGPESRYLQFVNLSFRQIAEITKYEANDDANQFVIKFLDQYPNYPVLRLKVEPGEAYIAPAEFMIHDGSSDEKKYVDATTTILGDFGSRVVHNMIALSEELDTISPPDG